MALPVAGAAVAQHSTAAPVAAGYAGPTDRYPHGALGDEIEHDTLTVTLADGTVLTARHAPPLVFEDTAPRLADLDGDGTAEILTVESHESRGARLAIWQVRDNRLEPLVATPFIGQRFRWLAPVGTADLNGDGAVEIAYVDRPHLAKILRIWRFSRTGADRATLTPVAAASGFTNHRFGAPEIEGGVRACGRGPELIVATADRSRIAALTLDGAGRIHERLVGRYDAQAMRAALRCD